MPEGDTIHRTAVNLSRALVGREVTRGPARLRGETVAAVESRGKHLLIWFAPSGLALHTHMRMHGAWHLYRPGQRWQRSPGAARAVLETDEWVAVCFAAPVCELRTPAEVDRHPTLAALGPDALDAAVDLDDARRRLDQRGERAVGEAIADQRVIAGVGNVYRCEVLHICGAHPWARVRDLEPPLRDALLKAAERLLKANTVSARRRTTGMPDQALWVYGRAGRPCRRCGQRIRADRQGPQARITFWCPQCQPVGQRSSTTDRANGLRPTPQRG